MMAEGHALVQTDDIPMVKPIHLPRISYRNKLFAKDHLLFIRNTLVEKCHEVILANRWVNDNQILKPQKIFQDFDLVGKIFFPQSIIG